jgi:GNAT superfamily N-acetyltransferase
MTRKSKIKIRFAVPADLNELARLFVLFKTHFKNLDGKEFKNPPITTYKSEIKNLTFSKSPLLRTLVAELDGRIVGAISFYPGYTTDTGKAYHFPYFLICPEYRGSKTALLLFDAIKKLAAKEKIAAFIFSVYGANKHAVKLYEHVGAKYWVDDDEHFMYMKI